MPEPHIPVDVVREFRRSLQDPTGVASIEFHRKYPEFCDKSMDYFEKMGKFAENAATKQDLREHIETVTNVLGRQTETINNHDRRINDLDYRVKHLEQLATHTKIAVDANTAISKQNLTLSETIAASLEQLQKSQKTKASILQTAPAIAWPVAGVVAIALIAAASGQMAAFIGWLDTIKIFGG